MSNQQITVGPPDLRTADRRALAVAKYLRHHPLLKQRPALYNSDRFDLFKFKRAARALDDPAYEKARQKNQLLPEVDTPEKKAAVFQQLGVNRLAFKVDKLETEVALARQMKPQSGVPVIMVSPQQTYQDEDYFVWFYNPVALSSYLWGAGAIVLVFAVVLFPLWPTKLRRLAWYVSMAGIGFVVFMIALTVIRLVLYGLTFFVVKPGIWLFPNLFEDVGFFASFVPLWAWHGDKTLPAKPKKKKRVKTEEQKRAIAAQVQQAQGAQGSAANPMAQALLQQALQQVQANTQKRLAETVAAEGATSPEQIEKIKMRLLQEEMTKVQAELQKLGIRPQGPKE